MRTRRGREFVAHQAANDWIMADFADGSSGIQSPNLVVCTYREWHELLAIAGGSFADEWMWDVSGEAAETYAAIEGDDARIAAVADLEGVIRRVPSR